MDVKGILSQVKFDPTITLGHIGSALLFAGTLSLAYFNLREEVRIHTEQISTIKQDVGELSSKLESNRVEIKADIRDLRSEIKKNDTDARAERPQRRAGGF